MLAVASHCADFLLTETLDSEAWQAEVRYAATVDRHLPPTWRKPALVGALTALSSVTATVLADHSWSVLALVNGVTNGTLAAAVLATTSGEKKEDCYRSITKQYSARLRCTSGWVFHVLFEVS